MYYKCPVCSCVLLAHYVEGSVLEKVIPEETGSILIQPFYITKPQDEGKKNNLGFVLVASSISYAYDGKDMLWIKAIANKLKGETINIDP